MTVPPQPESRWHRPRLTARMTGRIALAAVVGLGCGTAAQERRTTLATGTRVPAAAPAERATRGSALEVARADADREQGDTSAVSADLAQRVPTPLDPPPFEATVVDAVPVPDAEPAPRLVRVSQARNRITDEAEWFARNGFAPLAFGATDAPAHTPTRYGSEALTFGIARPDHTILVFGGRLLAVLDHEGAWLAFFDFHAFMRGSRDVPADRMFTEQSIVWAEARDGVLYVAHAHRSYAKSSGGRNAYISALDLATGRLRWRSAPLVANARNFVVHGAYLVSGYGFTAEPDWLYVLDRATGAVASRTRLRSGPDAILEKDGRLHVRTYDTDYVFSVAPMRESALPAPAW